MAVQISREEWIVLLVELRQWVRERKELNPYPLLLYKNTLKWIQDTNLFLKIQLT